MDFRPATGPDLNHMLKGSDPSLTLPNAMMTKARNSSSKACPPVFRLSCSIIRLPTGGSTYSPKSEEFGGTATETANFE